MSKISITVLGVIFAVLALTLPAQTQSLSDIGGHQYQNAIQELADLNIIGGYPDGTYKPNNAINRAEFLKIVIGAAANDIGNGANCFPDVKSEWFAKYLCYAKNKGIVEGYPDGYFRPAQNVNYMEALKILYEANNDGGLSNPNGAEWYAKYYEDAVSNGISIDGVGLGKLMNRGEIAKLTWNYRENKGLNPNNTGAQTSVAGALMVSIEPAEARAAGARWRRMGETTWMESGQSESKVPSGTHTIEFFEITGWTSPARPQISHGSQASPTLTAYYHRVHGAILHVDDSHSGAANGSAQRPYASLQAAIENASHGDTIKIAVGSYGHIVTQGKALSFIGGFPGATSTAYAAGQTGDFSVRTLNPSATTVTGGASQAGVTFTRFNDDPYHGVLDNLKVYNSQKGVVCDTAVSWPQPSNLTMTNTLIENNGQAGETSRGAGILVCGEKFRIANSTIKNNRGGRGPAIHGSVLAELIIDGNRIEDNTSYDDHGGGLYLNGPVTISNNLIAGNRISMDYGWGGGVLIHSAGTTAYMKSNIIRDNHAPNYGGAVFVDEGATLYMQNDLVYGNTTAEGHGAGVAVDDGAPGPSHVYMNNCTIAFNNQSASGGSGGNAVFVDNNSTATISNSVFWGNGDDFFVREGSSMKVTYSLSQEGFTGTGNISVNPLFADAANGNYHLLSTKGRFDSLMGQWKIDAQHSPAIDAGNPSSPYGLETAPNGGRVNMGAYGNTARASHSK